MSQPSRDSHDLHLWNSLQGMGQLRIKNKACLVYGHLTWYIIEKKEVEKKDHIILKPNLMCLPLNNQGQWKTAPQSPGENMLDACGERNPAHPWPFGHPGCSEEPRAARRECISKAWSSFCTQKTGQEKENPCHTYYCCVCHTKLVGGIHVLITWEIKSSPQEYVLSNSTAEVLTGCSSDSTAQGLRTGCCPRGLHWLYSTAQRIGLKKTRKPSEMGMWAIFISPFKNTALPLLGLLQDYCPNTLALLNNYTFKLESAAQLMWIFSL